MKLDGYGIEVDLPRGWEGRIYRRAEGDPTLHAATFALHEDDGDFGGRTTGDMAQGQAFVVVTEYDPALAGQGLFAPLGVPRDLRPVDLAPNGLMRPRPGLMGVQRFFTASGRALCLYVVVGALSRLDARGPLNQVNQILRTVRIGTLDAAAGERPDGT
jgi:hypothetical protein